MHPDHLSVAGALVYERTAHFEGGSLLFTLRPHSDAQAEHFAMLSDEECDGHLITF